jgi:hypothetical protein
MDKLTSLQGLRHKSFQFVTKRGKVLLGGEHMTTKMNETLSRQIEAAKNVGPEREIPVIVTLRPNSDLSALEQLGVKIQHIFRNISAVRGTLTPAMANRVAELEMVELIEYDGEVHAL